MKRRRNTKPRRTITRYTPSPPPRRKRAHWLPPGTGHILGGAVTTAVAGPIVRSLPIAGALSTSLGAPLTMAAVLGVSAWLMRSKALALWALGAGLVGLAKMASDEASRRGLGAADSPQLPLGAVEPDALYGPDTATPAIAELPEALR